MKIALNDTIAAISTGMGAGGIGIVRISGPDAWIIAGRFFFPEGDVEIPEAETTLGTSKRKMFFGFIRDPETNDVVDEVLTTFMTGPRTYSGEHTVEINTHGGRSSLIRVLELALTGGARLAEPGEFTRRAFFNGRIDLTQAEAVIDLINARSELARQRAVGLLQGGLRDLVVECREILLGIRARIGAGIDFPDDVDDTIDTDREVDVLKKEIIDRLDPVCGRYRHTRVLTEGLSVAIIGRPNVGKSSLLNALLQRDRAIVTETPGTTRDTIEEAVDVGGIPVVFIDTAGLRPSEDPVEKLGMERSMKAVENAQLVLFVIDATEGLLPEERIYLNQIDPGKGLVVINKIDLSYCPMEPMADWKVTRISAKTREGIEELESAVSEFALREPLGAGELAISPNLRQTKGIESAISSLTAAVNGLKDGAPEMIIDMDLSSALDQLDAVLGEEVSTDLLDEIFSRFCIGK